MAVLGYKVAGTVGNVGTVNWGVGDDLKASIQGTAPEDGWITHLGARLGGDPLPATAALAAYKASGSTITDLVAQTATIALDVAMVNSAGGKNYEAAASGKIESGVSYGVAIGARSGTVNFGMGSSGYPMHRNNWSGTFPNPYAADSVTTETKMVAWIVYQPNQKPTARDADNINGAVLTSTTPTLRVGFSDRDTAYGDGFSAWRIVLKDEANNIVAGGDSAKQATDSAQRAANEASWVAPTLTGGVAYTAEMTVWDDHDLASIPAVVGFTIGGQGEVSALALTDIEGYVGDDTILNTGTPGITGTWNHATGEPLASLQVGIFDEDTDAVVRELVSVPDTTADGGTFALAWPGAWPALPAGTRRYRWAVKGTDDLGGQTDFAASDPFIVNAAPNMPTSLAPSGSVVTAYPTLSASCSDPTDAASLLTVTFEVRPVGGSATSLAASHDTGATFIAATSATEFPAYGEYEWRAIAEDPWGLSATSAWRSLSYLAPPAITEGFPATDEAVATATPTVTWSVNRAQARYRVTVREQGGARVFYQSGYVQSAVSSHPVATPLPNLTAYDLVLWVETIEGSTTELTVPFSTNYAATAARTAEEQTILSTAGTERQVDEVDEIVIDNVSIPVRQIQRTDTARFEGKVTFGDYSVDSDQLMSTWAQSTWVGGGNVATHIEGATDTRYRWARAWTQSNAQLTLPLAATRVDLEWAEPPASTATTEITTAYGDVIEAYRPWVVHDRAARPLGARNGLVFAACGAMLSAVNAGTGTAYAIGALAAMPVGEGAWYGSSDYATLRLWIPLGEHGLQTYNHQTDTINPVDATVPAVAVATWDTKLFALTVDRELRIYDRTGTWRAATDDLTLPPDETPAGLVRYFDRSGNAALAVITDKQVWLYNDEAGVITPLGFEYPRSRDSAGAATVWRDDGLYVADRLGVTRVSTAGVITPMGLDRDDGFQITAIFADMPGIATVDAHRITALCPSTNMLLAAVRGYVSTADGVTASRNVLMGWNEAGWHYVAALDRNATGDAAFTPCGLLVADTRDGYQAVVGSAPADLDDATGQNGALYLVDLPEGLHAPRQPLTDHHVAFADEGVLYTGWIDAAMSNFYKAWSHVEVTLARPDITQNDPPGVVEVSYRTEQDPSTWHYLGAVDRFGRTVLPINTINGVDRGLRSTRIELMVSLRDTSGAHPLHESPIVESIAIKFIKLAQAGAAWLVHVPLSDFDLWRGLGPEQIDAFLSRLAADGSSHGPFQRMLHKRRTEEGVEEDGIHRVRVAQWQRSEGTGRIPFGDGVLNLVAVEIQDEANAA